MRAYEFQISVTATRDILIEQTDYETSLEHEVKISPDQVELLISGLHKALDQLGWRSMSSLDQTPFSPTD